MKTKFFLLAGLVFFTSCAEQQTVTSTSSSTSSEGETGEMHHTREVPFDVQEDLFKDEPREYSEVREITEEEQIAEEKIQVEEVQVDEGTSEIISYKVQKGETLLQIAFKTYGDYAKWRKIASLNPNLDPLKLPEGENIQIEKPSVSFEWNPEGLPYQIQEGDSLGEISQSFYGMSKFWKDLFEHNRPLIKDPNIIFAGLTMYCPEEIQGIQIKD